MHSRKFEGIWIPADLWLRKDLSLTEKLLYLEIKSLDNDFGCTATNKKLAEPFDLKPSTVSGYIRSLEDKGFLSVTYSNMMTFEGRIIVIKSDYSTPSEKSIPPSEKSGGASEKSIHSNTISNTNSICNNSNVELPLSTSTTVSFTPSQKCELYVKKFNEIRKSKFKPSPKLCKSLSEILKTYTTVEIFKALRSAMRSPHHIEHNFKYLTPEFMLRVQKIEMYLNSGGDDDVAEVGKPMTDDEYENFIRPKNNQPLLPEPCE